MSPFVRLRRGALVCLLALACQTYTFQPYDPVTFGQTRQHVVKQARSLKPNVMLLVDRSGSMRFPISPGCTGGGCATRISELRAAMRSFLPSTSAVARFGLTVFPSPDAGDLCGAPTYADVQVQLPAPNTTDVGTEAQLADAGERVLAAIEALQPLGGTPTNAALSTLLSAPGVADTTDLRQHFVIVLTDGVPNCNDANPNAVCTSTPTQQQLDACACTESSCGGAYCRRGCLDANGTVAAVTALAQQQVKVVIIGFGAEAATTTARATLEAMGAAGNYPRACHRDPDCGADDHCTPGGTCARHFLLAGDGAGLEAALAGIGIGRDEHPCEVRLEERPSDPKFLAVDVDGTEVLRGPDTWQYAADVGDAGAVEFTPDSGLCQRLLASTEASPVVVDVFIVEKL